MRKAQDPGLADRKKGGATGDMRRGRKERKEERKMERDRNYNPVHRRIGRTFRFTHHFRFTPYTPKRPPI